MSVGDIYVKDSPYNSLPVETWQIAPSSTIANPGEPMKVGAAGCKYAIQIVDGDGVIGTTTANIGLVAKASTQTSTVTGAVDIQLFMPGVVYAGKAKSSTAANTQALIDALKGKRVIWDLTSSVFTVDTAASDNANNALLIVGGDYNSNTVYFLVRNPMNLFGCTL